MKQNLNQQNQQQDQHETHLNFANIFIIGAAKSGTTHLCNRLKEHSQIYLCDQKEPCFFSLDSEYEKGLSYYSSLFSNANESHKVLIDGSTQYSRCTMFKNVPERIFKAVPNAKFIYIMRHPVERAFSHYTHRWIKEVHPGEPFYESFEEFTQHDSICLEDGLYKLQIEHYLKYFPIDRFLFLLTEELNSEWEGVLKKIYDHTNLEFEYLDFDHSENSKKSNIASDYRGVVARTQTLQKLKNTFGLFYVTSWIPPRVRKWLWRNVLPKTKLYEEALSKFTPTPMKAETREILIDYYKETVDWVETLLGKDLSSWRK